MDWTGGGGGGVVVAVVADYAFLAFCEHFMGLLFGSRDHSVPFMTQ